MAYVSLFISAFISATLFPGGSEALLIYTLHQGGLPFWLWFVATVGNVAGACVNYIIGYRGEAFLERKKWLSRRKMNQAKDFFNRWGAAALLLSWMPVIGDPITLVAGAMRFDAKRFLVYVFIAKGGRYASIVAVYASLG